MTIQLGEAISFHQSCRSAQAKHFFSGLFCDSFFPPASHPITKQQWEGGTVARGGLGGGARLESARELRAGRDGGRNGSFRRHDGGCDVIAMSRMGCWAVEEVI